MVSMDKTTYGFQLPEELARLRLKFKEFNAKELLPLEEDLERVPYDSDKLPPDDHERLTKKAKAEGMWGVTIDKKYGGQGLNSFANCLVSEEFSQHRAGLYAPGYGVYGQDAMGSLPSVIWGGTEEQIKKYAIPAMEQCKPAFWAATEEGPGSDYTSVTTSAVRQGDYYILNGVKWFVSWGLDSEWGLATARTGEEKYAGISVFIVEKNMPGVTITPQPGIRRAARPAKMVLDNAKIPAENLLGEEGKGSVLAAKFFSTGRAPYSARNVGVSVAANRLALEYAKKRVLFGEPLSQKQAIQWMLADSEIEIRAARWLVWEAGWAIDSGKDARMEVSVAKVFSSETLGRAVDRAVQILGGWGVDQAKHYPLERWYREARIRRIGEGPSEVHRFEVIAKRLLKD